MARFAAGMRFARTTLLVLLVVVLARWVIIRRSAASPGELVHGQDLPVYILNEEVEDGRVTVSLDTGLGTLRRPVTSFFLPPGYHLENPGVDNGPISVRGDDLYFYASARPNVIRRAPPQVTTPMGWRRRQLAAMHVDRRLSVFAGKLPPSAPARPTLPSHSTGAQTHPSASHVYGSILFRASLATGTLHKLLQMPGIAGGSAAGNFVYLAVQRPQVRAGDTIRFDIVEFDLTSGEKRTIASAYSDPLLRSPGSVLLISGDLDANGGRHTGNWLYNHAGLVYLGEGLMLSQVEQGGRLFWLAPHVAPESAARVMLAFQRNLANDLLDIVSIPLAGGNRSVITTLPASSERIGMVLYADAAHVYVEISTLNSQGSYLRLYRLEPGATPVLRNEFVLPRGAVYVVKVEGGYVYYQAVQTHTSLFGKSAPSTFGIYRVRLPS